MRRRYLRRERRWLRWLRPPLPLVHNPREKFLPASTGPKLFIGGAGGQIPSGFLNLDIIPMEGVDIVADLQQLPFRESSITAIECDAVLEHVAHPEQAVAEMLRVLKSGSYLHVVVPFCHPFHEYPSDYQRWSYEGLRILLRGFAVVDVGVRT